MRRLVFLVLLCVLPAPAADSDVPQSTQQAAEDEAWHFEFVAPEVRARRDRILAEIAAGEAGEWAGWYVAYPAETLSEGLLWAPGGGYLLYFAPDGPWLEDVNHGGAALVGGVLRLRPEAPIAARHGSSNTFSGEFRCVRWGSSRFLVPPDRLAQFCDAAASGDIREVRLFLGTVGGWSGLPRGRPEVPAEYRAYLAAAPVVARVTSVLATPSSGAITGTRVVLSAGSAEGVRPEMKFWLHEPRLRATADLELRVDSVEKHTSEAVVEAVGGDPDSGELLRPKVGWRFRNRLAE